MSKDNSEPAFPVGANEYGGHGTCFGITVRDYFAAKAMQAIITGNNADHCSLGLGTAKDAYIVADAMLATRSA